MEWWIFKTLARSVASSGRFLSSVLIWLIRGWRIDCKQLICWSGLAEKNERRIPIASKR
jgi:hypothetical protein